MKNHFMIVGSACLTSFLFIIVLLVSSCTSCSGNTNHVVVVPDSGVVDAGAGGAGGSLVDAGPPVPPKPTTQVVKGDTWSISLPSSSDVTLNPEQDILFTAVTEDIVYMVSALTRESFQGSYDEYIIYGIRGIRASGATVLESSQATNNSVKYTLVEAEKDDITIWNWLSTKNNFGYAFSCGGVQQDNLVKEICLEAFQSLQLL